MGDGGNAASRETDRITDRGGKFSFVSKNYGVCGFSIMSPGALIATFASLPGGRPPAAKTLRSFSNSGEKLHQIWERDAQHVQSRCHSQRQRVKRDKSETDIVQFAKYFMAIRFIS